MRRAIYLLAGAVLILVLAVSLSGCAKAPEGDTGAVTQKPASQKAQPPAEAKGTVESGTIADVLRGVKKPSSYEMTMAIDKNDAIKQVVMLQQGKPWKMKMESLEDKGTTYMDFEANEMYIYSPDEGTAMRMPLKASGDDVTMLEAGGFTDNATMLGSEKVGGLQCWVLETTDKETGDKMKAWMDKKYGLLRKVDDGKEVTMFSYDRINKVKAAEFELPAGVEVMDLGAMQNMPKGP